MPKLSYYEQLCKDKGIKIGLMQRYAREADKADARKRRKLRKEAGYII